jgi:NADP-dependent 3-hydroxy acid dehydrogenase YdfG
MAFWVLRRRIKGIIKAMDSPFCDIKVQREKLIQAEDAAEAIWFLCQQPVSGVLSEMVLQPFNHQAI